MIIGIAVMIFGIGVQILGGFTQNTAVFIAGGIVVFIGLCVVLFNNHDDQ